MSEVEVHKKRKLAAVTSEEAEREIYRTRGLANIERLRAQLRKEVS